MNITEVRVNKVESSNGKLVGIATVLIDDAIIINNIKIINNDGKRFISFPSIKLPDGKFMNTTHPVNSETREIFEKAIFAEFDKTK